MVQNRIFEIYIPIFVFLSLCRCDVVMVIGNDLCLIILSFFLFLWATDMGANLCILFKLRVMRNFVINCGIYEIKFINFMVTIVVWASTILSTVAALASINLIYSSPGRLSDTMTLANGNQWYKILFLGWVYQSITLVISISPKKNKKSRLHLVTRRTGLSAHWMKLLEHFWIWLIELSKGDWKELVFRTSFHYVNNFTKIKYDNLVVLWFLTKNNLVVLFSVPP